MRIVFTEQNGAQFDMHLHPPTTPAQSGMHDFAAGHPDRHARIRRVVKKAWS